MLHDKGGDRVGSAHDSDQRDCCSELLFCIDIVERLLCAPFNAKEEKEGEKCQNTSVCHLNEKTALSVFGITIKWKIKIFVFGILSKGVTFTF